ncbi:MAG: malonate transporter subunit MadL [Planctomycetota bacterium]
MVIYGTGLLAICLLVGVIAGRLIGMSLGLEANVGGVGIAMLLLIVVTDRLQSAGRMSPPTNQGILFWSAVYIPVVVAMAASRNVIGALDAGGVAIIAGVLSVLACFALVPLLSRISAGQETTLPEEER